MPAPRRDPLFAAALAAGPAVCLSFSLLPGIALAPGWPLARWPVLLLAVAVYPALEETVFRGGVQPWLADRLSAAWGPLTAANALTSIAFTGLHFLFHPPLWALGVLIPSLLFGFFRERHGGLFSPILLHAVYNASYYLLLSSG